jgi:hypothetical protein
VLHLVASILRVTSDTTAHSNCYFCSVVLTSISLCHLSCAFLTISTYFFLSFADDLYLQ